MSDATNYLVTTEVRVTVGVLVSAHSAAGAAKEVTPDRAAGALYETLRSLSPRLMAPDVHVVGIEKLDDEDEGGDMDDDDQEDVVAP